MNAKTVTNPLHAFSIYAAVAASVALLFVLSGAFTAHAQVYTDAQAQAQMQAQISASAQQLASLQAQAQAGAAASGNFALRGNLTIGSRGSAVSELQRFLATDPSIYPEGLVTGYYGQLTAAAVQRFQCRHGITCSGSISSTGYGRVGPITFGKLIAVLGLTGTGGPATDVYAPIMSAESVSTTSNSATIVWLTNEPARSRVMYATTFPFVYAFASSVADATAFDLNQTVTISNLLPNTTYFYVRESTDVSGNVQLTVGKTFRTGP